MRGMIRARGGLAAVLVGALFVAGGCASAPIVTTVLTQALPENVGREGRVLVVEYPPGVSSAAHRHPGAVFVYVMEGAVECGLDEGGPVVRYEKGQAWYERPGQLHRVARNASRNDPAKLVVFFLTEAGKPVLEKEN